MEQMTLEQAKRIAQEGDYGLVPLTRELYADAITPTEVMRILKNISRHCYMLESAEDNKRWGRYTFLGYEPALEITCRNGSVQIKNALHTIRAEGGPGECIRQLLSENASPAVEGLPPFTGGLVGYFSYDYIKYSEPGLVLDAADTEGFQDVDLMLFDKVIAFDNYRQKIILIANAKTDDLDHTYNKAMEELRNMEELIRRGRKAHILPLRLHSGFRPLFEKEEYCGMVERAKHYIREGDIFQVVLSNRLEADMEGSLFDTYRILRTVNPSPYMFYFSGDSMEIAGASSETLVKLEDGTLYTFPLAGTRPRGADREEDERLERELLADEKECAEHNMLVDLGRNDIGRIAGIGCTSDPRFQEAFGRIKTRWMQWTPSCLRERFPERPSCGPVKSLMNWKIIRGGSTAAPLVIWALPGIWIPVSPSAWPMQKTERYSSAPAPALWRTASRKRNIRNALTRQRR